MGLWFRVHHLHTRGEELITFNKGKTPVSSYPSSHEVPCLRLKNSYTIKKTIIYNPGCGDGVRLYCIYLQLGAALNLRANVHNRPDCGELRLCAARGVIQPIGA